MPHCRRQGQRKRTKMVRFGEVEGSRLLEPEFPPCRARCGGDTLTAGPKAGQAFGWVLSRSSAPSNEARPPARSQSRESSALHAPGSLGEASRLRETRATGDVRDGQPYRDAFQSIRCASVGESQERDWLPRMTSTAIGSVHRTATLTQAPLATLSLACHVRKRVDKARGQGLAETSK
jgi:hypothetical protein